jgi:hypothetical protein
MLWPSDNHHVLCTDNDLLRAGASHGGPLRAGNHGLLCTGANDGLLRGANDRILRASAGGGWYHTRRLCSGDVRDTTSDVLCTSDVYHGLSRLVVSTIFSRQLI